MLWSIGEAEAREQPEASAMESTECPDRESESLPDRGEFGESGSVERGGWPSRTSGSRVSRSVVGAVDVGAVAGWGRAEGSAAAGATAVAWSLRCRRSRNLAEGP